MSLPSLEHRCSKERQLEILIPLKGETLAAREVKVTLIPLFEQNKSKLSENSRNRGMRKPKRREKRSRERIEE